MTLWGHRVSRQLRWGLLVLAPILIVFVLLIFFPPDGNERAQWAQFIGRFHLLVVHFPIALFLLVPVLELAGRTSRTLICVSLLALSLASRQSAQS